MGALDDVTFAEGCGDVNSSQLSRIEFFLADLHWSLLGSIRQSIFDAVPLQSGFESSSVVPDLCPKPEKPFMRSVSKAKLRRQRAAKVRAQMWKSLQKECKNDVVIIPGDSKNSVVEEVTSGFANSCENIAAIDHNECSNEYNSKLDTLAQLKIYIRDGSIRSVEFYPCSMAIVGFFVGMSREPLAASVSKQDVNELMLVIREHGASFMSHLRKSYDGSLLASQGVAHQTDSLLVESLEAHCGPSMEILECLVEDCLSVHYTHMNENMHTGCREMALAALTEGHSPETVAGQFAELLNSSIDPVVTMLKDRIETKWPGCSSMVDIEAAARQHLKEIINFWISDATSIAQYNIFTKDASD